nr:hypothetical protein [Curtobacterium pusillum]GLK30360.1 hypothetical protein GCM10017610_06450 [Curtobacterium pusillum]
MSPGDPREEFRTALAALSTVGTELDARAAEARRVEAAAIATEDRRRDDATRAVERARATVTQEYRAAAAALAEIGVRMPARVRPAASEPGTTLDDAFARHTEAVRAVERAVADARVAQRRADTDARRATADAERRAAEAAAESARAALALRRRREHLAEAEAARTAALAAANAARRRRRVVLAVAGGGAAVAVGAAAAVLAALH